MTEPTLPPPDAQRIDIECTVDDLKTTGTATRRDFTRAERIKRTARTFGILFMIGCFSVVVPLLHLILPPLLLIVASVMAFVTWLETAEVIGGEIGCPNCKKTIELQHEAEEWPHVQRCPGCSFTLTITPRSNASVA
jgi:DNA-directed RNA polymerase subunit RPC12/RpoP